MNTRIKAYTRISYLFKTSNLLFTELLTLNVAPGRVAVNIISYITSPTVEKDIYEIMVGVGNVGEDPKSDINIKMKLQFEQNLNDLNIPHLIKKETVVYNLSNNASNIPGILRVFFALAVCNGIKIEYSTMSVGSPSNENELTLIFITNNPELFVKIINTTDFNIVNDLLCINTNNINCILKNQNK